MSEPALGLEAVGKHFGIRKVLDGIDLDLPAGAVSGLVGPNGAGKTTLFSIIAGFLRADRGRLSIQGHIQVGTRRPAHQIGILPQDARFLRQVPVREHLIWYARLQGFGKAAASTEADRVLDLVDLRKAARAPGSKLSHGMHKRMATAQAFIGDPAILLLDEPTAGLDPTNAHALRTLIREQRGQRLVLLSSHNLDEIADLCNHVNVLSQGRLVDSGGMSEFTRAQSEFSIILSQAAPDDLTESVATLDGLESAQLNQGSERLQCFVAADDDNQSDAIAAVIQHLAQRGIAFSEVKHGASFEQRFLDVTATGGNALSERGRNSQAVAQPDEQR